MLNCDVARMSNLTCCYMLAHIESSFICSNVVRIFFALLFLSVLQNGPSGFSYAVLDVRPDSGVFPDSGGFVQHF